MIEQSLTHFDGKRYSDLKVVKHQERLMNELADAYEGFAGVWMDPNDQEQIYISLADKDEAFSNREEAANSLTSIARGILEPSVDQQDVSTPDYRFTIEKAEYSFRQLQYYRDLLTPLIHQRSDIVKSFIDIDNNLFSIGVLKGTDRTEYNDLLETYSIPSEAISIYETEPVEFFNGEAVSDYNVMLSHITLQDFYRPLTAGFQIHNPTFGTPPEGTCTFGFNVKLNGADMWITNSHCTDEFSSTDNAPLYQHVAGVSGSLAGTEFRDNPGLQGTPFGNFRWSDAALIEKESGVSSSFGVIAKTTFSSSTWGINGSLIRDDNDPTFEIISDDREIMEGMTLHKVGRTTGWTRGTIASTCANVDVIDQDGKEWTLSCQIFSTTFGEPGDSGSPAFIQPSFASSADLVGILFGGNDSNQVTFYSPVSAIKDELTEEGETLTIF